MSAATDTIARNAAQIAASRSQERQQIEALRYELAAVMGKLDAATRENAALLTENASLRTGRALALMALDTLPSTDMLPEEGRQLLLAATAHIGVPETSPALARQWPMVHACTGCGGTHPTYACAEVAVLRDADPIPALHDDLAKAQTAAEREQVVARIRLARAQMELDAARAAL